MKTKLYIFETYHGWRTGSTYRFSLKPEKRLNEWEPKMIEVPQHPDAVKHRINGVDFEFTIKDWYIQKRWPGGEFEYIWSCELEPPKPLPGQPRPVTRKVYW